MKLLGISIIVMCVLSYSCSNSTSPDEIPTLGSFLYGTYDYATASWSPNPNGSPKYNAESTDLAFLKLSSNDNFSMNLDIHVEQPDTTFNLYQEGSYITKDTEYVQPSGTGVDHWKGTLEFQPQGDEIWEVDFLIYKNQRIIGFLNNIDYLFGLPNSGGYIWVSSWRVK
jgi:hypothetical protein